MLCRPVFLKTPKGLKKIKQDFNNDLGVDADSDASELKAFLKSVLPDYDESRVYVSDMKKLVRWYGLLVQHAPEIFLSTESENKESEKA